MCGHGAEQDLHKEKRENHPEIFGCGLHRWRDLDAAQRIGLREIMLLFFFRVSHGVMPAEQGYSGEPERDAERRPEEG